MTKHDGPVDPMAPLYWGYNQGLPRTGNAVTGWTPRWSAAWGARAQLTCTIKSGQRVHAGYRLVAEWQSTTGPEDEVTRLLDSLTAEGHDLWLAEVDRALAQCRLLPGSMDDATLYDGLLNGLHITVKASHEGWEGWLLVVAYTHRPGECEWGRAACDTPANNLRSVLSEEPNLEFSYGRVVHAGRYVSSGPVKEPLCSAKSRRQPMPSSKPVDCQACLQQLAAAQVSLRLVTDKRGQCPVCGDFVFTLTSGQIAGHQAFTRGRPWCWGAGQDPYNP